MVPNSLIGVYSHDGSSGPPSPWGPPGRHRPHARTPGATAACTAAVGLNGLALGALRALHDILVPLWCQSQEIDSTLIMVLSLAGGCGWLAVLALYAGGPTAVAADRPRSGCSPPWGAPS